jgi:hypothetical protein
MALAASGAAKLGAPEFALVATNVPPRTLGFCVALDAADFAGADVFGVGSVVYVDYVHAGFGAVWDVYADATGIGAVLTRIPADPGLANKTLYAQMFFTEPASNSCSTSPVGAVSSRGLQLTILP